MVLLDIHPAVLVSGASVLLGLLLPLSESSVCSSVLTAVTTVLAGKRGARPEARDATWLVGELLRGTDVGSGSISLFPFPMNSLPTFDADEMKKALETILEEGRRELDDEVDVEVDVEVDDSRRSHLPLRNASRETRDRIASVRFSSYQFERLPRRVLGRAYANLQHLDIRQNASLTSIDSIVIQLPNLVSLNLSDCPNVRTLAPLAAAIRSRRRRDHIPSDHFNNAIRGNRADLDNDPPATSSLNLRHLWVTGCDLSAMPEEDWKDVFDALAESNGPLERLTLSRNKMRYLHSGVGKLKGLTYLYVEDNNSYPDEKNFGLSKKLGDLNRLEFLNQYWENIQYFQQILGRMCSNSDSNEVCDVFCLPDELGDLPKLRFLSLCGNNIRSIPRTLGRLGDDCDVHLHRNLNLQYPASEHRCNVKAMRLFFHREKMALLRGAVRIAPHLRRARLRANERLYRPGGDGYTRCKERFEESAKVTSIVAVRG